MNVKDAIKRINILKKQIKECKHQKNIIRLKWKVFDLENKKLRE